MPTNEKAPVTDWEIMVGHYGKVLIMRFVEEADARKAYADICEGMEAHSAFKNDRKHTLEVVDAFGQHTLHMGETKSVSIVERRHALALIMALDEDETKIRSEGLREQLVGAAERDTSEA